MILMGIINISGISESRVAPICHKIVEENQGQTLIITPSYIGAKRLGADLAFFTKQKIYILPAEEEGLVNYEAKNRDAMLERLVVLNKVLQGEKCIVVAPISVALKKCPPPSVFAQYKVAICKGQEINISKCLNTLIDMGYQRVPLVYAAGQFSMRGGIIDVFTPYMELPVRIELFDNLVEDIRTFDKISQRSIEKKKEIAIYPAEILVGDEEIFDRAREKINQRYAKLPNRRDELITFINNLTNVQQLENYMDYFYEETSYIWDYMNKETIIMEDPNRIYEKVEERSKLFNVEFQALLEQGKVVGGDLKSFPGVKEFLKVYEREKIYLCTPFPRSVKGVSKYDEIHQVQSRGTLSYNGKMDLLERELNRYLQHHYKVTIVCSNKERQENMQEFLSGCRLDGRIWTKLGTLTSGIDFPEEKICYITDADIFGKVKKTKRSISKSKSNRQIIQSFADIEKGDYVVHERHGIGRFVGLDQLEVQGEKKDYIKIQYAGEDFLYIPATQMDLIQKYIGKDVGTTKINKLSGGEWRVTKAKAKASIEDMAKELLEISANRESNLGHSFAVDTPWQKEFEDSFPFEETADQLRCIQEIKADMEKPQAMDRLLCGDVGYGKTEVAARGMFKCAVEGKQVVLLVPTTILANQHYYTLKERFEKFPFTVEMLSRFRTDSEQKEIVKKIKKGTVDVVIGTHRLLSKDVEFKDLGLLIIDEEQRFGVKAKEKMKALRKNVDVLTLSATPIPRTLHMSLVGIRDMSLIEEPPEERYPVQTYVMEEDDFVIREAIERELDRGGQVYIINNRVNGIERVAQYIDKLVPNKRIGVGHGRMGEEELEDIMIAFMEGDLDILIATTIIESGIDIPNVNTVIVLDADKFGLSQLYQLRGRVGRSNRLAYAYLTHKKNKVLTEVAEKRMRAIREFTEFGAGFKISMRDLEIRGAGNVLGSEQHGHMVKIGYELYCKLVDDAVRVLKGEKPREDREETTIEIGISAYIPSSYIQDEIQKLTMYKKIAGMVSDEDEEEIREELIDRYGDIPKETLNLMRIGRIRLMANSMGIVKVRQHRDKVVFSYGSGNRPVSIFLTPNKNPVVEIYQVLEAMSNN